MHINLVITNQAENLSKFRLQPVHRIPTSPPSVLASTSSLPPSTPPPHPDLFKQVPKAYHDYLDVFSEAQANTLPPHRKYDLDIPLQPGTTPPWGPICSMSALEL